MTVTTPSAADGEAEPLVRFIRAMPGGLDPMRADRSALGTIPAAAFQYCEAVTSASAFGYYVFLPRTVWLQWDGTNAQYTHDGVTEWLPVKNDLHPDSEAWFDPDAPEDIKGYCPPWVAQTLATGVVQLWTGLFMVTREGWSSLARPLANVPRSKHYEVYEGLVETDRWFGPLFINIRMTAIDTPVELPADRPLFQIQPLLRATYAERQLKTMQITPSLAEMSTADWERYRNSIVGPTKQPRMPGGYAVAVRKRLAAES